MPDPPCLPCLFNSLLPFHPHTAMDARLSPLSEIWRYYASTKTQPSLIILPGILPACHCKAEAELWFMLRYSLFYWMQWCLFLIYHHTPSNLKSQILFPKSHGTYAEEAEVIRSASKAVNLSSAITIYGEISLMQLTCSPPHSSSTLCKGHRLQ